MGDEFVDILNHLIKFENDEINFIIDHKGNTWFKVKDILKYLEIKDPKKTIKTHIEKENKMRISDIDEKYTEIFPNMHKETIFVNEYCMYDLILRSRMEKAKKFRVLLITKILPSLREYGIYEVNDKNKLKLTAQNKMMAEKMKKLRDENKILKNDMKKNKYKNLNVVYAMRPKHVDKKLLKIGKSTNMKNRMNVINNALPNDADILYYIETKKIDELEKLIKIVMSKYVYKRGKEYYEISVPKMKIIFNKCEKQIEEIFGSKKMKGKKYKIKRLDKLKRLKTEIVNEIERQGMNDDVLMEGGFITNDLDFTEDLDQHEKIQYDLNNESIYLYDSDQYEYQEKNTSDNSENEDTDLSDDEVNDTNVLYAFKAQKYKHKYLRDEIRKNNEYNKELNQKRTNNHIFI